MTYQGKFVVLFVVLFVTIQGGIQGITANNLKKSTIQGNIIKYFVPIVRRDEIS